MIAITNLNIFACMRLMILPKRQNIYYYKENIKFKFLYNKLACKHYLKELNLNVYPNCLEDIERYIVLSASDLVKNIEFFNLGKHLSILMNIGEAHVRYALIKYFIRLLRDDLSLLYLIKKYHSKNCIFIAENYEIFRYHPFNLRGLIVKWNINSIDFLFLFYRVFMVLLLLVINFSKSCINRKIKTRYKVVFIQRYSHRYGGNPEFEGFYRYFQKRNDIAYLCKNKDKIYRAVLKDEKAAFTHYDLTLSLDGILNYLKLIKNIVRYIYQMQYILKINVWSLCVFCFYEYLKADLILKTFLPEFVLTVRPEMNPNHPIITGVCERFGCKNIGYRHGPPAYFDARMEINDFHYLGVMGKSGLTHPATGMKSMKSGILGPFVADICHDISMPDRNGKKIVTFLATSNVFDPGDKLFKCAFRAFASFMRDIDIFQIIYRDKNIRKKKIRISYVQNICKEFQLNYSLEDPNFGKSKEGFSSFTIKNSHVVIVCSLSSAAWECLSLGIKFLVFGEDWLCHPFERFLPNLVVKNDLEFNKTLNWIWPLSCDEFRKQTKHIVEHNSKISNGKMVQEFFEDFVGIDR